jgi:hypothetical protein
LGKKPTILSVNPNAADNLRLNRFAVGPWERIREYNMGGGEYAYRSLANGKYICNPTVNDDLRASCDSAASATTRFTKSYVTGGFKLRSVAHNRWVRVTPISANNCGSSPGDACHLSTFYQTSEDAAIFSTMRLQ